MTRSEHPEVIADFACEIGEGPLWHPGEHCLYWTDIPAAKLLKYCPETDDTETYDTGSPVGRLFKHSCGFC